MCASNDTRQQRDELDSVTAAKFSLFIYFWNGFPCPELFANGLSMYHLKGKT